ncbi:hypothetical protein ACLESO_22980 [Pyxidicoccus sp. 3LG]
MRRRLLIVLLALGTFGGYASGFASIARHHRYRCHSGGWGERWDSHSRWDSRGPRESWEPRASRGYVTPAVEAPTTPAAASPTPAEGPR